MGFLRPFSYGWLAGWLARLAARGLDVRVTVGASFQLNRKALMRRLIGAALVAVACTVSLSAQVYMPNPVAAWLDAPVQNATVAPSAWFGGWAFNWQTCRHVAAVQLWRIDDATQQVVNVPATVYWGPRPDVRAYAQWGGCPSAEEALGFTLIPNAPLPYGASRYVVTFSDMTANQPGSINWNATIYRDIVVQ